MTHAEAASHPNPPIKTITIVGGGTEIGRAHV